MTNFKINRIVSNLGRKSTSDMMQPFGTVGGRQSQQASYASGAALRGHMASCHDGKFDDQCRACKEILAKQGGCQ